MVCHGNTDYLQWMTPALREEAEAVPDWLPPLDRRPVDVAFTGCATTPVGRLFFDHASVCKAWELPQ